MKELGVEGMLMEESGTGRRKKVRKILESFRQRGFCKKKKNHRTVTLTIEKDDLSRKYFET